MEGIKIISSSDLKSSIFFSSSRTLKCVPYDFVCDGELDCPDGEDEQYCYGIQENDINDGYYEIMQQEFGVWHTKCFPKSKPPTEIDLFEVCRKLGYATIQMPKARTRIDTETGTSIKFNNTNLLNVTLFTFFYNITKQCPPL